MISRKIREGVENRREESGLGAARRLTGNPRVEYLNVKISAGPGRRGFASL
jgi:hypothetical protein